MSEIVEKIKEESVNQLSQLVVTALVGQEKSAPSTYSKLGPAIDQIVETFNQQMIRHFDELMDKQAPRDAAVVDFETLSLVQEDELEVMVALEGMVNNSRNEHLPNFISFNTRLNSLFSDKRIDETTNPLDPDQIASAFQEAMRAATLSAQETLQVYRAFNENVLKQLRKILEAANKVLIDGGVMPDLGLEGPPKPTPPRARASREKRPADPISAFGTVEEEEFEEDDDAPELFSMMQNLMHPGAKAEADSGSAATAATGPGAAPVGEAPAGAPAPEGGVLPEGHVAVPIEQAAQLANQQFMVPAALVADGDAQGGGVMQPFQPDAGQQVQMVDQAKLMDILTSIQAKLDNSLPAAGAAAVPTAIDDVERLDISQSLGEILSSGEDEGIVNAVDRQSSDIINLVTLLYEAIWQDESVPIPIKELIGRTQITVIKVALSDTSFFDRENHPARVILNEFASAGIGWTEVESLADDPLYQEIQRQVTRIQNEYDGENTFFEDLIKEFRNFRAREAARTRQLEQSILKAKERNDRLEDIHELVTQKIEERLLGREIHPYAQALLEMHFHKFMVMLVLKEGPGGNAWKQAVNTIDVLLWTVSPHEQEEDRKRLETINPRLLNNLRKAFRIAGLEIPEIDDIIVKLQEVQQDSFEGLEPPPEPEEPEAPSEPELPSLDVVQQAADEGRDIPEPAPEPEPEPVTVEPEEGLL